MIATAGQMGIRRDPLRVASIPSSPGIRASASTTSGRVRVTTATASRPSSPRPQPGGRRCWPVVPAAAPANQRLVVGQHNPNHVSDPVAARSAARGSTAVTTLFQHRGPDWSR